MSRLSASGVVLAAVMALMTPAPAASSVTETHDKLAFLTFTAPVQVPGVTLNAGTYRFRLTNPKTSRNVLQVLSNDGGTVYAMFHTIPDGRASRTDDPVVSFMETPAGVPPAVKSLFYGGEYRGYEFVYPEGGPIMIATVVPQPAISYSPMPVAAVPEPIAEPAPEPVPEPEALPAPVPEPVAQAAPVAPPVELPKTASPLPFAAVGGFVTLLAGLGLGLVRKYVN